MILIPTPNTPNPHPPPTLTWSVNNKGIVYIDAGTSTGKMNETFPYPQDLNLTPNPNTP